MVTVDATDLWALRLLGELNRGELDADAHNGGYFLLLRERVKVEEVGRVLDVVKLEHVGVSRTEQNLRNKARRFLTRNRLAVQRIPTARPRVFHVQGALGPVWIVDLVEDVGGRDERQTIESSVPPED